MTLLLDLLFVWLLSLKGTAAQPLMESNYLKEQKILDTLRRFQFSCEPEKLSNSPSSSVHTLRPSDIKAIAALGVLQTIPDSRMHHEDLTQSPERALIEVTMETLAAFVSRFNPSVLHRPLSLNSNRAASGTKADGGILDQAKEMVKSMKENQMTDFQNDWKLMTVFFSAENPCSSCASTHQENRSLDSMERLKPVLDFLYQEVPKAFVNLVDFTELKIFSFSHTDQNNISNASRKPCNCVDKDSELDDIILKWSTQNNWEKLLKSGRYDSRDDFTVVLQPFLQEINPSCRMARQVDGNSIPKTPEEITDKECSALGVGLWNNMMEPVGQKEQYHYSEMLQARCPSKEHPYLFTYRNSNYSSSPGTSQPEARSQERSYGTNLPCIDRNPSNTVPVSVHNLRPADIKVVGALGDSITAGNGAGSKPNDVLDVLTQYRGLSWSIGGNENISTVTTLPNILLEFNPSLQGYSIGTGKQDSSNAFLNQAVAGDRSEHVPSQARRLVDLMKNDTRINFQEDWKLITLFIGGNDLCRFCQDPLHYSPENFTSNIKTALDILHKEVPRTFVNLVTVLHIVALRELYQDKNVSCPRLIMRELCPCVLNHADNSTEMEMLESFNRRYQEETRRLVESGRYDTQEDFTVVMQPLLEKVTMPKTQEGLPDSSYFAPDCFHFHQKAHSQAARALWNNMLEPLGEKTDSYALEMLITMKCPSQHKPFLGTYRNSNYTYPTLEPTNKPIQNWGSDLLCPEQTPSKSVPTSVHNLRPIDIRVIAALGDSLTTAVGAQATSLNDLQTPWRGLSWSIGGDGTLETHTTLPNILKKFNPELFGFSMGTSKETAGFNSAVGGAIANNMSAQARELVELMRASSKINFEEDWKLITLFIGGNDLCRYCLDKEAYSVENYVKHLQDTLDILYKELPRVFVNMVEILEMTGLRQIERETSGCVVPGTTVCPCFLNPLENSPELQEIKRINKDFQIKSMLMASSGRYARREDFTVVVQPFFRNTIISLDSNGKPDLSFFSMDCFHFTERGYAEMAAALWNNMLEPLGQKQSYNNFTRDRLKLKCPTTENPFLFTSRNSGLPTAAPTVGADVPSVPYWAVILAAVTGILAGSVPTGVLMARRLKKHQHEKNTPEMKLTVL